MHNPQKNRTIITIGLITLVVGIIVLLGWIINKPALQSIIPGFEPMRFNTALCFVSLAIALLLTQYQTRKFGTPFLILSLLVTLIGVVTLLENLFGFNARIDQLFVTDRGPLSKTYPFPGRMAFNAALSFSFFGLGFLLLTIQHRLFTTAAQYFFHTVIFLATIALIGYLYGASLFYSLFYVSSMATHTAILFFSLSIAASLLNPTIGITKMFTGKEVGNRMGKRLFILMLIPILTFGSIRVQTQHFGLFSLEVGISLLAVSVLLASLLLIWDTSKRLNKIDKQRTAAEEEIRLMNADLEQIVAKRSAQYQKSEAKYRLLIEQASDAIYMVDSEGNFTDANNSMCKMMGYTHDELLKLNVENIIDPEELKTDPVRHGLRKPGEYVIRERRLARKDGSVFDAEINVKAFQDNMTLVIARDITDRKRIEGNLREAELKFRTLAERSMVGVYISQREKFVYVNPRFSEIFGYEGDELINTDESAIGKIISEDFQPIVRRNVEARYQGKIDNVHYEVKGKKKDGTTNWVEFYGSRVTLDGEPTIIGSMIDISERKLAEELVLKEKALSETIINSLPGVFYLQNEGGDYLRWNKNFETVMGYSGEEISKMKSREMVAPEDLERVRETVMKIFSEGSVMVEANGLTKDGTLIPFLITSVPIIYQNQRCILGTGIDISSRIKAQEELKLSEQKYKLLFDSNPVPLWMIAKDDMSIIAVNDTAANLYGYSKEELLNSSAKIFRPKEDLDKQTEGYRLDISTSTDMGVVKHLKKDGTMMFVQIIAHDIIFDGRSVRLSLTNDITEKLKAEESLQKSEANLQAILKTTDTAYALLDMELKVLEFNQKATQFVKEQYNHIVKKGDRLVDYFPKDRLPQFANFAREVLAGRNISYEVDYPQANGSVYWFYVRLFPIVNDNNDILGMMMALYDITERKNAEEDLKNAYERIQNQVNSIKDMAWKQSHLIRSPLANLKALTTMLDEDPSDTVTLAHIRNELNRLDEIIIEMAEDASAHDTE